MRQSRILFVDAYDSFSNNIIALLEDHLGVETTKISIDAKILSLPEFLLNFSAVVVGPGPGTAEEPKDVGLMRDIWDLCESSLLPVLGICLGFQSLVLAFGGSVSRLRHPRHGIETEVKCKSEGLFQGLTRVRAVQYHSLHAIMGHDVSNVSDSKVESLWRPSERCPDLVPLAWDIQETRRTDGYSDEIRSDHDAGWAAENPMAILMAVKHLVKPFFGVQFHPESVCSSENARRTVLNWWEMAQVWNKQHRPFSCHGTTTTLWASASNDFIQPHTSYRSSENAFGQEQKRGNRAESWNTSHNVPSLLPRINPCVQHVEIEIGDLDVPSICESLGFPAGKDTEWIVLDSEKRQSPTLGKNTIIGLISPDTLKISYATGSGVIEVSRGESAVTDDLLHHGGTIFSYLRSLMECCHVEYDQGNKDSPFWGGLMGYISYEAGLETIGVSIPKNSSKRPDLSFAFVERSIVINHLKKTLSVQSIRRDDQDWVWEKSLLLKEISFSSLNSSKGSLEAIVPPPAVSVKLPSQKDYLRKIAECREEIQAGESYELCLTDQTTILTSTFNNISPWSRYLHLRNHNPAPFAAFIRLGPLALLSSSPERFLSWTRPIPAKYIPGTDNLSQPSICQFRPIKGTVAKYVPDAYAGGAMRRISHAEATTQLHIQKEVAENLMIADLIRHDLHGVVGAGNVRTAALMSVEEYESVYQLVTVIEGTLPLPPSMLQVDREKTSKELENENETNGKPSYIAVDTTIDCIVTGLETPLPSPTFAEEQAAKRRKLEKAAPKTNGHIQIQGQAKSNERSESDPSVQTNGQEGKSTTRIETDGLPKTGAFPLSSSPPNGIDLLASSLPPGSMTGAPKLRSCQLLSRIEQSVPRSVYAGVLGYMDVGGGGDFSVVIRTAWRWDDDEGNKDGKEDPGTEGDRVRRGRSGRR